MLPFIGQLAALGTSFAWAFSSIFFTLGGQKVGSQIVNRTRLIVALICVAITHLILYGKVFPVDAEPFRFGWLALSGIIGFVIGDSFLFQAFVMIGPRISMLMMSLGPVLSTLLGWIILGENLSVQELGGIVLTVGGIAMVVTRRGANAETDVASEKHERKQYALGIVFGLGAAIGQSVGLLASKLGLAGDFPALSGNLIRLLAASIVLWAITAVRGQVRDGLNKLREQPVALREISIAAFVGPFLGVWLSLIAIQRAPLGIAATLMALPPVILLPIGKIFFKEEIGPRAVFGTILAFIGTVVLFVGG